MYKINLKVCLKTNKDKKECHVLSGVKICEKKKTKQLGLAMKVTFPQKASVNYGTEAKRLRFRAELLTDL